MRTILRAPPAELAPDAGAASAGGGVVEAELGGGAVALASPDCSGSTGGLSSAPVVPPVVGLVLSGDAEAGGALGAAGAGMEAGGAAGVGAGAGAAEEAGERVGGAPDSGAGRDGSGAGEAWSGVAGGVGFVRAPPEGPALTLVILTASGAAPGLSW